MKALEEFRSSDGMIYARSEKCEDIKNVIEHSYYNLLIENREVFHMSKRQNLLPTSW